MKKIITSLVFLLLTTITFSQINHTNLNNNHICNVLDANYSTDKNVNCANPDLEYYLKRPPIITNFIVAEDREEKIELVLKDEYNFSEVEIIFFQYVVIDNVAYEEFQDYIMYDDGSHGDVIANDKTFTNNEILLKYSFTNSYTHSYKQIDILYKENGQVVHSDLFPLRYVSVDSIFLNNIDIPNIYRFDNDDFLFSDHFIYYNKYNNWPEIECNQLGVGGTFDYNYINSKSLLYEFWGGSVINNGNDKNLYMQVDFTNPGGQFLSGQDMALMLGSLNGVEIHEILHYWIPNINSYLGYDPSENHHANIFRNTSGFLYSSWSRTNGIYCESSINDIETDDDGTYLYIDWTSDYQTCNEELESRTEVLYYNDLELYLMNIIPIEDVEFPFVSLVNVYNIVPVIDPDTGYGIAEKHYFDSVIEVDQAQLVAAKNDMLNDLGNPPHLDASNPNNFLLTFSGNKSNLSNNEIKMLWVFSNDLTTIDEPLRAYSNNNFYKATGERAEITANIPLPLEYTGDFFTTEYINIFEGENYLGWTESGVYERILDSEQYNDSIVTTHLSVNPPLALNENYFEDIKLYPNPTSSTLFIECKNFKSYTLFNSLGVLIKSSNEKVVDVSSLASGLYFIKIVGLLNEQVYYSKIIVD